MDMGLENKVVLVTAASKGIGFEIAKSMLREGAKVAISSRSEENLRKAAEQLSVDGAHTVFYYPADLINLNEVDQLLTAVLERFGRIDVLVSNTGGPKTADFVDTDYEEWQHGLDMILFPALQMTKRAIPSMIESGWGRIIFMTSSWVKQPRQHGAISTISRSAVSGLSKHLSNELGKYNILVNQVMPGPIWTERSMDVVTSLAHKKGVSISEVKDEIAKEMVLNRYGTAEEVANMVTFLASERASFITGACIQVDGGQIKSTI
jgi:3-oxoacyl-[acyl-carrier protein] reductase